MKKEVCVCPKCNAMHLDQETLQRLEKEAVCAHCSKKCPSSEYAVKNSVWKQSGAKKGLLHLECLEERIGRKLVASDFNPNAALNIPILWAFKRGAGDGA